MDLRRHLERVLWRAPVLALAAALAWVAGSGVGGAALAVLRAPSARDGSYADPLLPESGGAPGWRGGWSESARSVASLQGDSLGTFLSIATGLAAALIGTALVGLLALLLARSVGRRSEMAMRATLGARRRRLAAELLVEGGALAAIGGALAALAAGAAVVLLRRSWPVGSAPWREPPLDGVALGAVFALFALATLACWLAPVAAARGPDLRRHLGAGGRATPGSDEGVARGALVVFQVAASLVLLATGALLLRGSDGAGAGDPVGFDPSSTLTLRVTLAGAAGADAGARASAHERIIRRVSEVGGVVDTSGASPGAWVGLGASERVAAYCAECWVGTMILPMSDGPARIHAVGPGFFRTLGGTVVRGRELAPGDGAGEEGAVVINETFAHRLFPNGDPLGKRVRLGGFRGEPYRVVGIAADVRAPAIGVPGEPVPALYLSALRHPPRVLDLAVRSAGEPAEIAPAVERAVLAAAPGAVVTEVGTMRGRLDLHGAGPRWFGLLFLALALASLLVAATALHGVMAHDVERRRREIGVRMAIGARPVDVARLVVGRGVRLAALGAALGMVGALALGRALQRLIGGVDPLDPGAYALPVAVLLTVAVVASLRPALRAAAADPQASLRGW